MLNVLEMYKSCLEKCSECFKLRVFEIKMQERLILYVHVNFTVLEKKNKNIIVKSGYNHEIVEVFEIAKRPIL